MEQVAGWEERVIALEEEIAWEKRAKQGYAFACFCQVLYITKTSLGAERTIRMRHREAGFLRMGAPDCGCRGGCGMLTAKICGWLKLQEQGRGCE